VRICSPNICFTAGTNAIGNGDAFLDALAQKWGFLLGEGRVDRPKAASRVLADFRAGRFRNVSFELPADLSKADVPVCDPRNSR
jgi:hypothetical protein